MNEEKKAPRKLPKNRIVHDVRDSRYETVKIMIEAKGITRFKDIFSQIPKTVVAHDIHTSTTRMTTMISNPNTLTFIEAKIMADLIGVEFGVLAEMIVKSVVRKKK